MAQPDVVDLTVLSRGFPEKPSAEVNREHLLETIQTIFEGDNHLVTIEGDDGIGKTTLLAQYAKNHAQNALSLFIKPTSRLAYSPDYLRLVLSEQIYWVLYQEILTADAVDEVFLRTHLPILQKRALRERKVFYFIIDGLTDIPETDFRIQEIVLKDILPLGLSGFKFLVSGDLKMFSKSIHKSVSCKSFPLPNFSLDDSEKYLRDLGLEKQATEELHKICSGIPGRLSSVKRMILSGMSVQSILDEDLDNLPDFLAVEWRKICCIGDELKRIIAVLAYGQKTYTLVDLSRILSTEINDVKSYVNKVGFFVVDSQSGEIGFISEAHRKFAAKQLQTLREETNNLLIDDLLRDRDSNNAVIYLPNYYEQAGRLDDLLQYLSPHYFTKLMEHSHSLSPLHQRAELGFKAARKQNRNESLMRFSLQSSVICELEGADVWSSEVEARMALKEYDTALALANTNILKEDRLHLLAIIARIKCEQGLPLDRELIEQVELLYDELDVKDLGSRGINLAKDLVCVNPDLAIKVVESITSNMESQDRIDTAYADLSFAALKIGRSNLTNSDAFEKTKARIKNQDLQEFSSTVALLFGEYTISELISHVDRMEIKNRLYFLQQWALANEEREDAASVIEYALDLLIKNTPYTPKTRDLREIATPLPYVSDRVKARQLVGRFDSQKALVAHLGTTIDYVRLQLLLAQTESSYDFPAALNRCLEIYWYISELKDLALKTECMAWMVALLNDIDPDKVLESMEGFHTVVQDDFKAYLDQLLLVTAEHYYVARGAIKALARRKPEIAIELALSLNIEQRRDDALLEFIRVFMKVPDKSLNLTVALGAINKIVSVGDKDIGLIRIVERLSQVTKTLDSVTSVELLPLIKAVMEISDAQDRCKAACFAYSFLIKQNKSDYATLCSELLMALNYAWKSIDIGWFKVNAGFEIATALAEVSVETAKQFMDQTEKFREYILMDSGTPTSTYMGCLKLAMRAFSGLLPRGLCTDADVSRLQSLIDQLPSYGERVGLWSEVAVRYYLNKQVDMCQKIVSAHVKPLLDNFSDGDHLYKFHIIISNAPALYCAHRISAFETISKLPQPYRDFAYGEICDFIFNKLPMTDPIEHFTGDVFTLSFEEMLDICEIVKFMRTDYLIYSKIVSICDSLISKKAGYSITKLQKNEIADRLEDLISEKLPDKENIQHDGYKIAALVQVTRIRQETLNKWEQLIHSARKIPNIADKALVLIMIACAMQSKYDSTINQITEEAKSLIDSIPIDLDRLERYLELAEMIVSTNPGMARKALRSAMALSTSEGDEDFILPRQRRIIDLAHRIDSNFAASLASIFDDDPARSTKSQELAKHLKMLETSKEMLDPNAGDVRAGIAETDFPRAAWKNLGALNAGRIEAVHFEIVRNYLDLAAQLPLYKSYPILAFAIENVVKRVSRTDTARTYIVPFFEATLLGAELAGRIASRSKTQLKHLKDQVVRTPAESKSIIIGPGEREEALKFLKEWLAREVHEYLKICDPYFGVLDLEALKMLRGINPNCKVYIFTSKRQLESDKIDKPWDDSFRDYWHVHISDQDPPDTTIVIADIGLTGDSPIHDRWWLTHGSGLKLGTSFNSLGITKVSGIDEISEIQAAEVETLVDSYLRQEKREHRGTKVKYNLFTL